MVVSDLEEIDKLRKERETSCFKVINRGKLWYDTLTDAQLLELKEWYVKWLNVTETKCIPATPSFVNNKVNTDFCNNTIAYTLDKHEKDITMLKQRINPIKDITRGEMK